MLIDFCLKESADRFPEKAACIFENQECSYAEFSQKAQSLAASLLALGLQHGERVIIWLGNCLEAAVAIFGILEAGGVFVPLHSSTKAPKMAELLHDCRASMIITSPDRARALRRLPGKLESLRTIILTGSGGDERAGMLSYDMLLSEAPKVAALHSKRSDQDLACLIYTSGSTGRPKAVVCAHYNVRAAISAITSYLQNTAADVIVNCLPLSFDYGLYQLLMSVYKGGTLVLEPSFAFPAHIVEVMRKRGVTGLPGVPSLFALLLQLPPATLQIESLSYITNTGAALPASHIKLLRQYLPNKVRIFSMYGQTECKRALYLPPAELSERPESVGIAIPGEEAYLINGEGKRLPPGSTGELVVEGPNVMLGYWERPAETASRFVPTMDPNRRALKTGDLFHQDEAGFFYFVARQDDIIKSRGQKVSPKELEAVLYHLTEVQEAAVIGVPHEEWGEAIEAHIVLQNNVPCEAREILRHCKRYLEDYLLPDEIVFHDKLPKSANGKINHGEIRKEAVKRRYLCKNML